MITHGYFINYTKKSSDDFPEEFIAPHITNGELKMISFLGEQSYLDVEELLEKSEKETLDRTENRKLTAFRNAECELVMASLLPDLNLSIGDLGIVRSSQNGEYGEAKFTTASPRDVDDLVNAREAKAWAILSHFKKYSPGVVGVKAG